MTEKDPTQLASDNDPRVYFAAERTLLAWMRTGLAVVGVGFLVARFGLFLRMLRHPAENISPPVASSLIGIGFVLLGAFMIGAAAWQHTRFCGDLHASERPTRYLTSLSVCMAVLITGLSLALAVYLLVNVFES